MMKDQKTIKEFADDLGVTRQTIHYYLSKKLSKELSKERTKNEKGIVVLTSLEQDIIKKSINQDTVKKTVKQEQKYTKLQAEQIQRLEKQNAELSKLLDQQQQLQLRTQNQLEEKTKLLQLSDEKQERIYITNKNRINSLEDSILSYRSETIKAEQNERLYKILTIALSVVIVVILGLWWFL
ncbi:hypothetical protein PSG94_14135 [Enterococcus faecalis]|uniref:hypothetical protein n=1 Tax=Enterococcus faecalis TaxID=1351 RepID=UPI002955B475|nr:hypothetical protein [Enterococcus faecalis]MDV7843067.1 hypothetical protein [Enterococcus faecalis]